MAVPATVSDEPSRTPLGSPPGRRQLGDDPRARRPAVYRQESDRLAGVPGKERALSFDLDFPSQQHGSGPGRAAVTVVVCTSCRDEAGSDAHPRAGELLAESARSAATGRNVDVRTVECLGNCKRRLSASVLRDGSWSYVFGDLSPASGADLVAGAELFATSSDGLMPWRGRPDSLKRGLIARIPPLDLLKD